MKGMNIMPILTSDKIRVFDSSLATSESFFTGGLNLQKLEFDPLVTGTAFIIWTKIPNWVETTFKGFKAMTQKNFKGLDGIGDIELQTGAYEYGFANNEYHVATQITKQNTEFTLRHQEYSGSPITNMYKFWVSGIRDPETGIATYPARFGLDYAAKNHTGSLLYIMTRPDANNINKKNIEFASYWTNVFPTKYPLGHYNYSQGTNDLVEIEMPFKGTMHLGPNVEDFAHEMLKSTYTFITEDLFDPNNNGQYAGTIGTFPNSSGISGDGLGDDIQSTVSATNTTV